MNKFLGSALLGALSVIAVSSVANAATYDLSVDYVTIDTGEMKTKAIGYNGSSPGPTLRLREGES